MLAYLVEDELPLFSQGKVYRPNVQQCCGAKRHGLVASLLSLSRVVVEEVPIIILPSK